MLVIPIFLHYVDLAEHPLDPVLGLPRGMKPASSWHERHEAWWDVYHGVRQAILSRQLENRCGN